MKVAKVAHRERPAINKKKIVGVIEVLSVIGGIRSAYERFFIVEAAASVESRAGENQKTPVQGSRNLHPRFLGNFALIHQKICALCHPIHEDATGKFDAFTPASMPDKGGGLHTRESIENTRE